MATKLWGSVKIENGYESETIFPVALTFSYTAASTHLALNGHDDFGIYVGNKTKIIARKTVEITNSGSFTVSYIAVGI